jgi:hypothetical protein
MCDSKKIYLLSADFGQERCHKAVKEMASSFNRSPIWENKKIILEIIHYDSPAY